MLYSLTFQGNLDFLVYTSYYNLATLTACNDLVMRLASW